MTCESGWFLNSLSLSLFPSLTVYTQMFLSFLIFISCNFSFVISITVQTKRNETRKKHEEIENVKKKMNLFFFCFFCFGSVNGSLADKWLEQSFIYSLQRPTMRKLGNKYKNSELGFDDNIESIAFQMLFLRFAHSLPLVAFQI